MTVTPDTTTDWAFWGILLVWGLVGVFTLTMPLAFAIWFAVGVLVVLAARFGWIRFLQWGEGR